MVEELSFWQLGVAFVVLLGLVVAFRSFSLPKGYAQELEKRAALRKKMREVALDAAVKALEEEAEKQEEAGAKSTA
jgi:hypothetical protein